MVSDTIRRGSEIVARPRVEWCQTPFDLVSEAMLEEPTSDGELVDPRRSDVDEWGRSERMREVARAVYGPLYRTWHRVGWEGLDRKSVVEGTSGSIRVSLRGHRSLKKKKEKST